MKRLLAFIFKSYGAQVYDFDYSEILEVVYFGDKYNTYLSIAGKNK